MFKGWGLSSCDGITEYGSHHLSAIAISYSRCNGTFSTFHYLLRVSAGRFRGLIAFINYRIMSSCKQRGKLKRKYEGEQQERTVQSERGNQQKQTETSELFWYSNWTQHELLIEWSERGGGCFTFTKRRKDTLQLVKDTEHSHQSWANLGFRLMAAWRFPPQLPPWKKSVVSGGLACSRSDFTVMQLITSTLRPWDLLHSLSCWTRLRSACWSSSAPRMMLILEIPYVQTHSGC